MRFFESIRGGVSGAINFMVDKERKIALVSRVKQVIREEEDRANEAYIALGKYYFHNLRDEENNETEFYCAEIDHAEQRLQRAEARLQELTEVDSAIYNFDDAAFEEFCRECEEGNVENCEGCRVIPREWEFTQSGADEAEPEGENGMDVELPPQVRQAMDRQKEPAPEEKPEEKSEEKPEEKPEEKDG